MHPVQVTLIIGITSLVLVSAMLLVIRRMSSKPGVDWWLASLLTVAFAYSLALIFAEAEQTVIGDAIFITLQLSAHLGITIGTLLFFNQRINKIFCALAFLTVSAFTYLPLFLGQQFFAEVVFASYIAVNMLYVAYRLVKLPNRNKSVTTTAALCFLVGAHWLDYPFLKHVEWFAPIGFLLGVLLGMFLGLSLALLALQQFEKQTKESEQQAIYAATHDPLTGLYNRSHLSDLFNIYAKEASTDNRSFVMMYMDLDGFKAVNDTYGHKAGDLLLQVIAKRLTHVLQEKGDAIRIGGDELIALSRLRGECCNDNVYGLARKVLDTIEQPIVDGKNTYHVSASIGVCCYPLHGKRLDPLLEQADNLMYAAKQGGRRQIKFANFTKRVETPVVKKLQAAPAMADIA